MIQFRRGKLITTQSPQKRTLPAHRRSIRWLTLALILGLAAYLRLTNLAANPGWYTDEGTNLDVAEHLAHGQAQYMILTQSTLLVSRMPLFEGILSVLVRSGGGITTLRTFTALLGVLSVALTYLVLHRHDQTTFALLSAFLLAIYPQAVLYSRFGFSYNLLTILVLLVYGGLARYLDGRSRGWLLLAVVAIGLGTISDLWMLAFLIPLVLVVGLFRWRDVVWGLPVALLPFSLYAVWMLANVPSSFLFDLQFVLFRVSNLSLTNQLYNSALNYTVLLSQDFWLPCAVIGFLLQRSVKLKSLSLALFLGPIFLLGRTVALYNLSAYYMIPLLPFVAIGCAALLVEGMPYVWRQSRDPVAAYLGQRRVRGSHFLSQWIVIGGIAAIVAVPLLVTLVLDVSSVQKGFSTGIDPFLVDGNDAQQVIDYLNQHTTPADLVIVSPTLSWALHAHAADVQTIFAAQGQATVHFPAHLPAERFLVQPSLAAARFVIIDNIWGNWGRANIAGLSKLMDEVEQWPLAFTSGTIQVYANPTIAH